MKRAAGYIRVSQVGERSGDSFLSPELQREKIEAWAAYRDYMIVTWYVDLDAPASKGAKPRPEFDRMMEDARQGKFEAIAVYRLTRFARSLSAAASAYDELERRGVALVSVTEDIDTTTVAGNLLRNILFALAEFESARIGEEWRNVHAARRRKGIANVTRPMLGYVIGDGTIQAVEPAEAAAVRLIFEQRLKGASHHAIADALEAEHFYPKSGRRRFGASTLRKILRNPLYAGLIPVDDELVEAQHQAIVSRETWEAAQAMNRRAAGFRGKAGLLSGLVVCSSCGGRMWASRSGIQKAQVYRCQARQGTDGDCPRPVSIRSYIADEYVEQAFLRRFDPKRMPNRGRPRVTRQQQTWLRKAGKLRARAEELTRALDTIADQRLVKGSLSEAEYHRQFDRYARERAQAEVEAAELEELAKTVRPIERDVLALWPTYPVDVRQRALRMQVAEVVVKPSEKKDVWHPDPASRLEIHWSV